MEVCLHANRNTKDLPGWKVAKYATHPNTYITEKEMDRKELGSLCLNELQW